MFLVNLSGVAYTFGLFCGREHYLGTILYAFLLGGMVGSLYYGWVLEYKGRRWAVLESMGMMVAGLVMGLVQINAEMFSIGMFFFSAGFRGFYNAALLSIAEVTNETTRAATPMLFSIGWALGQIIVAFLCMFLPWQMVFILTAAGTGVLLFFAYLHVKDSPRFEVVKQRFGKARDILAEIAFVNERAFTMSGLREEE